MPAEGYPKKVDVGGIPVPGLKVPNGKSFILGSVVEVKMLGVILVLLLQELGVIGLLVRSFDFNGVVLSNC